MKVDLKYLFTIGFIFKLALMINCQSISNNLIKLSISDSLTLQPLEFAEVFNINSKKGTITDVNGVAILPYNENGDSIRISYLGYESLYIIFDKKQSQIGISLTPIVNELPELIIRADEDYLYKLLQKCAGNTKGKAKQSKSYLYLETKQNNNIVELIEAYYNAESQGYDLKDLSIKNGRLGLKTYDESRYFVSLSTTNILLKHKLKEPNDEFPFNPLCLTLKEMKRYYQLSVLNSFKNDTTHFLDIGFSPTHINGKYFQGNVIVDVNRNRIVKIELEIENSNVSPIIPIVPMDLLKNINVKINKEYTLIGQDYFLKSIYLDYDFVYYRHDGFTFPVSASAKLNFYDYNNLFDLPIHHPFNGGYQQDYRILNLVPYNEYFWKEMNEFRINVNKEITDKFFADNVVISNKDLFQNGSINKKSGFFQNPFLHWSEERFKLKQAVTETALRKKASGAFVSDLYKFNIDWYFDVNTINDSITYFSSVFLDQNTSFFYLDVFQATQAFANIYFDLHEVYRRRLIKDCIKLNPKQTKLQYKTLKEELNVTINQFIKDVDLGKNKNGMLKWNKFVLQELGIDNLKYFEVVF